MNVSRRTVLGGLAFAGLSPFARAVSQSSDRYFVFCWFNGGWDLLLGLDPRDPALFPPEAAGTTLIDPAFDRLAVADTPDPQLLPTSVPGMVLGPFAGGLVRHAARLSIVRGMSMDTLTHEVGRRRFATGRPPSGLQAVGSSIDTLLAAGLGLGQLLPNLAVGVESYNVDQPSGATGLRVVGADDLVRALSPGTVVTPPASQARIDAMLADFGGCETVAASAWRAGALEGQVASRGVMEADLAGVFDLGADTPQMEEVRTLYGFAATDLAVPAARAALAAAALFGGTSRCVSFLANPQLLDTHDSRWTRLHGPWLREGFDAVGVLLDDLAAREFGDTGSSWLDHTTVVCLSEFGRSALLNDRSGRDHSLVNACVLAGAGIRGGTVVGASSDVGMAPLAIDLATGLVDPGGTIVNPEHVWQALLESAGVVGANLGVPALSAVLSL